MQSKLPELHVFEQRSSWPWLYCSWIYNYLCNQCQSLLMLWVGISIRVNCTTLCDKVCQWLATGLWFSPGPPVSFTNKTDRHDITEILLKVALNTIIQSNPYIWTKLCQNTPFVTPLYCYIYWFHLSIYLGGKCYFSNVHVRSPLKICSFPAPDPPFHLWVGR